MLPDEGWTAPDQRRALPVERAGRADEVPSWAPAGWFMLVVVGTALGWAMCLPVVSTDVPGPPTAGQVFHLEWFLVSAALGLLVWQSARSSWRVGIASILVASLQVWSIADEGAHRLHQVGVVPAETDLLYVTAVLEIALFVVVGANGVRLNLADRRWARLVGQLAALDPAPRRQGR